VVDGVAMFVHQGAIQFERWTGKPAPVQLMRDTVLAALNTK
jgi:shikimate 5-dehydrogenase